MKELRDYKATARKPVATREFKNVQRAEMEAFTSLADEAAPLVHKDERVSNYHALRALDTSMQGGLNWKLSDFKSDGEVAALVPSEEIYLVENSDLPAEYRREGCRSRAVIEDASTGVTRFAVPNESIDQDALYIFSGQGSAAWHGILFCS